MKILGFLNIIFMNEKKNSTLEHCGLKFILLRRYTVRSERSDKSDFPIKCINNRNTAKYSQTHTIYLFIHIFTATARSDHLVNQYIEQFVFCCAAPFFSKVLHRCSLQIWWRADGDHTCYCTSPSSHIAYIGSKKNSPVVKGLANMVANDVACCEKSFDLQISIAKMTNIVRCLLHLVKTNIIFLSQHAWHFAILYLSNLLQENFPIYRSIKPYNRKTPTDNNAHLGHRFSQWAYLHSTNSYLLTGDQYLSFWLCGYWFSTNDFSSDQITL